MFFYLAYTDVEIMTTYNNDYITKVGGPAVWLIHAEVGGW